MVFQWGMRTSKSNCFQVRFHDRIQDDFVGYDLGPSVPLAVVNDQIILFLTMQHPCKNT